MLRLLMSFLILTAGLGTAAAAYSIPLKFDPTHTHIMFKATHLGISATYGEFEEFEGTLSVDEQDPSRSQVEITVQIGSLDSGYEPRDENLMGGLWFDVEDHPTMTFRSTRVEPTSETTATLYGDLTLKGVTKEIALDVTFNGKVEDPFSVGEIVIWGFSARGTINRSEFDMGFAADAVGDEVDLIIETEARQEIPQD